MARPAMSAANQAVAGHKALVTQQGPHRFLFEDLGFDQIVEVPMHATSSGREFDVGEVTAKLPKCELFISGVSWNSGSLRKLRRSLRPAVAAGHFPEYDIVADASGDPNWTHRLFALARLCGASGQLVDHRAPPRFSIRTSQRLNDFLRRLPTQTRTLVLHLDTLPHKMWEAQHWLRLLEEVLARRPDLIVLVVGLREPPPMARFQDRVISMVGMRLEDSMYLVSKAHVFAGVDSCMLHVADICNIPAVGIFVGSSSAEFGPCFTRSRALSTAQWTTRQIIEAASRFLVSV